MIKALQLLLDPNTAWEKNSRKPPSVPGHLFTYVLPLILLGTAIESWALVAVGRDEERVIERRVHVPKAVAIKYGATQVTLGIAIAFVGAWMFKRIAEGFHRTQTYSGAFATMGYALGPYYLLRILDAAPFINTWICWAIGAVLAVSILYRAIPRLMRPDPSNALGVYMLCSLLLLAFLGLAHFVALLVLNEKLLANVRTPWG